MVKNLNYYKQHPATQFIDYGSQSLESIVDKCRWASMVGFTYTELLSLKGDSWLSGYLGPHLYNPQRAALNFYTMQHISAVIRTKVTTSEAPLGQYEELMGLYYSTLTKEVIRMMYYILLITTRESRHAHESSDLASWREMVGPELATFHSSIRGTSQQKSVSHLLRPGKTPEVTFGEYAEAMYTVFSNCNYTGGYGGKAWAAIGKCLYDFVVGNITGEMFLDTAYTLCHNNGPIFNKGMIYDIYTNDLVTILDVQRAGQIPAYLKDTKTQNYGFNLVDISAVETVLGEEFPSAVDWNLVNKLGAVTKHKGSSPTSQNDKVQNLLLQIQKSKKQQAEKEQKEQFLKSHYEVMPHVYLPKIERSSAA